MHNVARKGLRLGGCVRAVRVGASRVTRCSCACGPVTCLQDLDSWLGLAALAYPSCLMRCAESWGFSLMTLAAGMLPDPSTCVAAISVAFNVYGCLYMGFSALSMTACAQVGNGLGAGEAHLGLERSAVHACTPGRSRAQPPNALRLSVSACLCGLPLPAFGGPSGHAAPACADILHPPPSGTAAAPSTLPLRASIPCRAGSPARARAAAIAACSIAPLLWLAVAVLLTEPHCQRLLMLVFTNGDDPALAEHLRRLFVLVAVLVLFDGLQYVLTGIVQGERASGAWRCRGALLCQHAEEGCGAAVACPRVA